MAQPFATPTVRIRVLATAALSVLAASAGPQSKADISAALFTATEQRLMDAVAPGDKTPWQEILDDTCVFTTEQGEVLSRQGFLDELQGLPPGLQGNIKVTDLTVQDLGDTAIVRFVGHETENVFGQSLETRYRFTDTFRRRGSAWKMVASHASVVTQDPPAQPIAVRDLARLVGRYRLSPTGWTFTVELRDGVLYGGRDPSKLRRFIPLTETAFVLSGSLGEWLFVIGEGNVAARIVDLRKFEVLIWIRT